jgi:Eukaryotic aspartyl protease
LPHSSPPNPTFLDVSTGSILFGGIDTAKYTGTLAIIDIHTSTSLTTITEFFVALTSVSASSSSGTDQLTPNGYAVGVVLDSGTTLTYLPMDLATLIFNEVGAAYNATLGIALVDCSLGNKNGTLDFGFGGHSGPQVSVPMSELVNPIKLTNGNFLTDSNGKQVCRFGISAQAPGATNSLLFGDTFLRSAYVVYDLENNQIGLAQAKLNTTDSSVVPFASKGATIPSATVAPIATASNAATTTVPTGQSLTAAKGFQSAAGRGLLMPLSMLELIMFTLGVAFFSLGGVSIYL